MTDGPRGPDPTRTSTGPYRTQLVVEQPTHLVDQPSWWALTRKQAAATLTAGLSYVAVAVLEATGVDFLADFRTGAPFVIVATFTAGYTTRDRARC